MVNTSLSYNEFRQVCNVCRSVQLRECTPVDLRDFLVDRLAGKSTNLARKIGRLDSEQMKTLRSYVEAARPATRQPQDA